MEETIDQLERAELPLVCANPDRVFQRRDQEITCVGALAYEYESRGHFVLYTGKPYGDIYQEALRLVGDNIDKDAVLAVGDSLDTDIQGAVEFGIDSLLVLSTGNLY